MKQIPVYNFEKKEVGTIQTPERMFGASWKADLIHQALYVQKANSRNVIADVKGRGEVRGGGKKPWKQKGTGRSRHGSIRSPIWIGGGVTHGPLAEKKYARKINKKMKLAALFSALSKKLSDGELFVIEGFSFDKQAKTKTFATTIKNIIPSKTSAMFVFSEKNKNLQKSVRNIPRAMSLSPRSLNVYDVLKAQQIIFDADAVTEAVAHFNKETKKAQQQ